MRSRTCTMEGPDHRPIQPTDGCMRLEEKTPEQTKRRMKVPKEEKDVKTGVSGTAKKSQKPAKGPDLTREDLIQLLGIMEGEVQAREDIIGLLKSERTRSETLEAHYGSAAPSRPLQALQRDTLLLHSSSADDVYEKPMAELDRLEDKQKETYRRMLEQLLLAEKCHRRTVLELDNEKRKHADFMNKSDDFTNLLEQERERLKTLLEQEKAYQARQDKEHSRRLESVRAELVKLKSFTLMLVDERQLHGEQILQQSQKIQDLTQKLQEKDQRLTAASDAAKDQGQKVLKMEAELEDQQAKFTQKQEEMASKLANQESQSQQLKLKMAGLVQKVEELEDSNKALQRSEEALQELRDKINKGECGSSSLVAELENLRKKVLEMEGKDAEILKSETQCRELRKKLQEQENHSKELKLEVDKLQKRMSELEKLEAIFSRSKTESLQLHANLEAERKAVKSMAAELDRLKSQLKELESSKAKLEKAETLVKDDLMKLKSFTVILAEERKNLAERLKQEKEKTEDLSRMLLMEQDKVTEVTEKLIEESKKLLKLKSETEITISGLSKEKEEMKQKLSSEEEKCLDLSNELTGMKTRLDGLEETEQDVQRQRDSRPDQDKVKELTLETERLRSRLEKLEVVEGDLLKTEDEYDLLEKKFQTEQDKANALAQLLDDMKSQMSRSKAMEKGEAGPEAELRIRCKMEEARSRELQGDVHALKEKIHELMNKEDQLSQLKVDFSVLKHRLVEEGEEKKRMGQEVENLTKELEATKRYSRALRPGLHGRRMVDVPVTSTAVQTDLLTSEPAEDETAAGFIRKSFLEEKHLMSNLRLQGLKKPAVLQRYPPASAEPRTRKSSIPWTKKEAVPLTPSSPERTNRTSSPRPPDMSVSQTPGQPLHIRVMPDHQNSRATLEITSPGAEDFFSTTTIIPTLGLQKPRITIVPTSTPVTAKAKTCDGTGGLDRAKSPVTIATISRAKSPEKQSTSSGSLQSPVSIITVSTTPVAEACAASDPHHIPAGRTVIKMATEKQAEPPPVRKYNGNIITTEDNKIHIHLGLKRPSEVCSSPVLTLRPGKDTPAGPCSPWQHSTVRTTQSKMTSSITITPVTSATSRPTPSVLNSDMPSAHSTATRLPASKGLLTDAATSHR